jgi:hypothetical protein
MRLAMDVHESQNFANDDKVSKTVFLLTITDFLDFPTRPWHDQIRPYALRGQGESPLIAANPATFLIGVIQRFEQEAKTESF